MSKTSIQLDDFTRAYIECALWSSTYETEDRDDTPMDQDFSVSDIADKTMAEMMADCADFQTANADLLEASGLSTEQQGHDFWLTRNHHGAGFWDRGLESDLGKRLTDAAHAYGSADLYIGDDGLVYCA